MVYFIKLTCYFIENNCTRRRKCPHIIVYLIAQRKVTAMEAKFLTFVFSEEKSTVEKVDSCHSKGGRKVFLRLLHQLKCTPGISG